MSQDKKAYLRAYYRKNKDKWKTPASLARRKINNKRWLEKNREANKVRNKAWRQANLSAVRAKARANAHSRRPVPSVRAYSLLRSAKIRAAKKGIPCTITREYVELALELGVCELTGLQFDMSSGNGRSAFSPSIDRIVLARGYVPGNVRVIVWALNAAFGTWGEDAMKQIVTSWLAQTFK